MFLPYLAVVVLCWGFFFVVMPETKNRSFDEIARDLSGETRKDDPSALQLQPATV